jgi:hypothetical protein
MYFATEEDRDRFYQEQDRRAALSETYRAERLELSRRMGDAQRVLGSQVGVLSDEEKTALVSTIQECRDRLARLDAQHTYYTDGPVARPLTSERHR